MRFDVLSVLLATKKQPALVFMLNNVRVGSSLKRNTINGSDLLAWRFNNLWINMMALTISWSFLCLCKLKDSRRIIPTTVNGLCIINFVFFHC